MNSFLGLWNLGPGLAATLVEEYANNEWHPGEIYHRMRQCHRQKNQGIDNLWFEKRWWAHLSCHEQRNVAALSHYDDIMSTCDDLLDVPGLRKDWRLTTWHKILSMRIDEVRHTLDRTLILTGQSIFSIISPL
jgi:hypothetical protein